MTSASSRANVPQNSSQKQFTQKTNSNDNFLKPEFFEHWLLDYYDQGARERLIEGAKHGVKIGFKGEETSYTHPNWPSAKIFKNE